MLFKVWLVLLFFAMLASLSSGLYFLMKDVNSPSKRTLYALGARITIAVIFISSIVIGYLNGWITIGAPWDAPH